MTFGSLHPSIEVPLPSPVIVQPLPLLGFYSALLALDYLLLRNERQLPVTGKQLRVFLGIFHGLIPLFLVSKWSPYNLFFVTMPWFFVAYSSAIPTDRLSFREWGLAFYAILLDISDMDRQRMAQHPSQYMETLGKLPKEKIRLQGLLKVMRGVAKLLFSARCIDPWLPPKYSTLLTLSWLSPQSLILTVLFGCKAYCFLGVTDILLGFEQVVLGWPLIDLFHSPILSYSPRDFWSRRWNSAVRNLLHQNVFIQSAYGDINKERGIQGSSTNMRGLLVFLISGTFHELLVMSMCRRMTLENFLFFGLHGLFTSLEVKLRRKFHLKEHPHGILRFLFIILNLSLFALTGRLFLAPFLRYLS